MPASLSEGRSGPTGDEGRLGAEPRFSLSRRPTVALLATRAKASNSAARKFFLPAAVVDRFAKLRGRQNLRGRKGSPALGRRGVPAGLASATRGLSCAWPDGLRDLHKAGLSFARRTAGLPEGDVELYPTPLEGCGLPAAEPFPERARPLRAPSVWALGFSRPSGLDWDSARDAPILVGEN